MGSYREVPLKGVLWRARFYAWHISYDLLSKLLVSLLISPIILPVVSLGYKQVVVPEMEIWGSGVWSKSDSSMDIRLRFTGLLHKSNMYKTVATVARTVIAMVTTVDQIVMIINWHQKIGPVNVLSTVILLHLHSQDPAPLPSGGVYIPRERRNTI